LIESMQAKTPESIKTRLKNLKASGSPNPVQTVFETGQLTSDISEITTFATIAIFLRNSYPVMWIRTDPVVSVGPGFRINIPDLDPTTRSAFFTDLMRPL